MRNLTTKTTFAAALTFALMAFGAPLAQADDAAQAEVSYNVAVTSDYRYRGLSQTRLKPALQGGADLVLANGFYAGLWASTIKWTSDLGGDGDIEVDLYAGHRGDIVEGISYDVGVLGYVYPSNELNPSANTVEVYGALAYGPAYVKYAHSTTNLFGTADSKNSGYVDLGANLDLAEGLVLNLHLGRQIVNNNGAFSYNDYKVGLTKDLGFASVSLAVIGADTDLYTSPVNGKNLAKTAAVLTVSKTF